MTKENNYFEGAPNYSGDYQHLARWLAHVLETPASTQAVTSSSTSATSQPDLLSGGDYHVHFYRQLPDFIMVLLSNNPSALPQYAPLLYHLAGCRECHRSYLELYDAMRAAIYPQSSNSTPGQGTRTLQATPPRMLGHLCQTFISQAEALLYQGRHEHVDTDAEARSLLQLAIRISAHIGQSSIRRQALQDLVRVATLFDGAPAAEQDRPDARSYTPVFAGSGSVRGQKAGYNPTTLERSAQLEPPALILQSQHLDGRIEQHEQTLVLHLQDLDASLRGHHVNISVLLGSLLEPVQWSGGNPRKIRSATPVDEHGRLVMPLGKTSLRLSNPEDRNLLEALFLHVEVQAAA